jgi:hypothetical protein
VTYAARVHGELVPVPRPGLPAGGALASVGRTTRIGLGIAGLAVQGAHAVLAGRPRPEPGAPRGVALWAGAAFGITMEIERRTLHAVERAVSAGSAAARGASQLPGVRAPAGRFDAWLVRWNNEARLQQRRNRAEAEAVVHRVVRQVTDAVLAQIDFVHIVDQIPMDEIVDHIDMEAILSKIDIGTLVSGVVKEVDLGGIIRESTEGVTAEAVDAVRSQTVKTDLFVSRVVDRVLLRKTPRDLELTEPDADASPEPH